MGSNAPSPSPSKLHARSPSSSTRASAFTWIASPSGTAGGNATMSTPMHATSSWTSVSKFASVQPASSSTNVAARTMNRERCSWTRVYAVCVAELKYVGGHAPSYR